MYTGKAGNANILAFPAPAYIAASRGSCVRPRRFVLLYMYVRSRSRSEHVLELALKQKLQRLILWKQTHPAKDESGY